MPAQKWYVEWSRAYPAARVVREWQHQSDHRHGRCACKKGRDQFGV